MPTKEEKWVLSSVDSTDLFFHHANVETYPHFQDLEGAL
jgi:hypothetical protein